MSSTTEWGLIVQSSEPGLPDSNATVAMAFSMAQGIFSLQFVLKPDSIFVLGFLVCAGGLVHHISDYEEVTAT